MLQANALVKVFGGTEGPLHGKMSFVAKISTPMGRYLSRVGSVAKLMPPTTAKQFGRTGPILVTTM